MPNPTCVVDDCTTPARSSGADYCARHYHRWWRHGDPLKVSAAVTVSVAGPGTYRSLYRPKHPLAGRNGKVYAHRAALYDKVGPGEHACHWCSRAVQWYVDGRKRHDNLTVDHLDGDKDNNAPANLVPSCQRCNVKRITQERSTALRTAGWWSGPGDHGHAEPADATAGRA